LNKSYLADRENVGDKMLLDRVIAVRNTKTVFRDGNKCIKVFKETHAKSEVLNEALNLAHAEELGLRVPHFYGIEVYDGKWAIVYEYIRGQSLSQLMHVHPDQMMTWLELFVNLQLEIVSSHCPDLYPMKEKLSQYISASILEPSLRYEMIEEMEQLPFGDEVCHLDFNPSNIILTDDEVPYIIDWAHMVKGNASADAAVSWLNFSYHSDPETANSYLELFSQKRNITRDLIYKWIPFAGAGRSVKRNNQERDFLLTKAKEYWKSQWRSEL
jgi:serine/threonine protein kinase